MNTTKVGQHAETAVMHYLQAHGFQVLDKNWRTRTCEVDVIAYRNRLIYFVEVKYRRDARQGDGLGYITPAKQRRMAYAARLWVAKYQWRGGYVLSAASVSGVDGGITFIEQI